MEKSYPFAELEKLLTPAQNIFVLFPASPTFDQVASSLALFLSLAKAGKQASVLSPEEMTVEFSHLVGIEKIGSKVPGGELVLTINTNIENIEKISTTDEDGKLNLIIKPKAGVPPVKREEILFSQASSTADLLFVIEARRLESLGKIYQENNHLFEEKIVVHLSHFPKAEPFGSLSVIDPAASSASEIMVGLLQGLKLPVDEDIGNNLLLGLRNATQNFQRGVTAETFEAAAFCLRSGAGRIPMPPRREEMPFEPPPAESAPTPSPDWLEPKIYKGSTLP